jgi:hypothetical protein
VLYGITIVICSIIAFGTATVLEIAAYYVPAVDNLLDAVATPAAVVAGTIATAALVADLSPLLKWTLAIIAGGGIAGVVQGGTVALRASSTTTTAGLANPLLATLEWIGSGLLTFLALVLPLLALAIAAWICFRLGRNLFRWICTRRGSRPD